MTTEREDVIQVFYGRAVRWAEENIVLAKGEPGFAWDEGVYKLGNGITPWNELDSYVPESKVKALIDEAIAQLPVNVGGGISAATLDAHVNSPTPHPAYDNMPSLVSRYRNRKV